MDKDEARNFLRALLDKTFRITASDGRMFRGRFQCTDTDSNVVLANTFGEETQTPPDPTARYVGLVIVPGKHIAKIEVEEFRSQMRETDLGVEYKPKRY